MPEFDALMGELDVILAKATAVDQPEDDKKIEAAAADADPSAIDEGKGDDDAGDKGAVFGKSFAVTLDDGTQVDAYDGTEMVKALHTTIGAQAGKITALEAQVSGADAFATKAVGLFKALQTQIAEQGVLIKALREQPGGRRSTITDPTPPARADQATRGDMLAKSLTAQAAGRISGREVAVIEARLAENHPIPAELLARVNAA